MAKVTLRDIARETGLSVTSVSLVLNDRPCQLTDDSKRRIREAARRLGYVPNEVARSLVMQRSHTLGLVIPNIRSRFFSALAHDLEVTCRSRGYLLLITNSDEVPENDAVLGRLLVNRGVDGLFLIVADELHPSHELEALVGTLPVPVVLVDRAVERLDADVVRFDNHAGGRMATECLLEQGHRRVAILVNGASRTGAERLDGYCQALEARGVPFDPSLVFDASYHISSAYEAAEGVVASGATACICTSDEMSLGLLRRLHEQGVEVPCALSVVGYDNSDAEALFEPALTAIEQDTALLAEEAVRVMLQRVEGGEEQRGPAQSLSLAPRLVVKDSVAPAPATDERKA